MEHDPQEEPIRVPISDELDLHTFRPQDLKHLIPDYLGEARAFGFAEVRIIHGKGIGTLRETVHALLQRDPRVQSFQLAGDSRGTWGATQVRLKPKS